MRADDTLKFLGLGLLVLRVAFVPPAALSAQSLGDQPVRCKGEIVSRIDVDPRPPFEIRGSRVQRRLAKRVTDLHSTTRPAIVRRFLALKPGMACTEIRRQESERILRAQPFLAQASVEAFPDGAGGVYLSVITVDEISLVVGGGASGRTPYVRALRLGEANLMGEAISVVGDWRHSEFFRDNWSARIVDYQFLRRPYQFSVEGARRELGGEWAAEASYPFLTDLQRVSWRTTAGSGDVFRNFRRPNATGASIGLKRSYGDAGGVVRIGPPGKLALLGASVSYEAESPHRFPTTVASGATYRDTSAILIGRYSEHRSARINALAGLRDVSFMEVRGFESLDGSQDVRKGVEIATLYGRGIDAFGAGEHDTFASANFYIGVGTPAFFGAMEIVSEGRRDAETDEWDGLLASGRLATYMKPATRHTILTSIEWSGGWKQRIPFQLSFADRNGGPRGYTHSSAAGNRRLVTRFEDRIFLGQVKQFASVGVGPFVDAGRLWAGDAPYGIDTRTSFAAGVGLLASIPPRSQRIWRLDLAFPVNPEHGARWELRLTSRNLTRSFWKEPGDVQRNRARSVPTSVFNWP